MLNIDLYKCFTIGTSDNTTHTWSEEDAQSLSPSSLAAQ